MGWRNLERQEIDTLLFLYEAATEWCCPFHVRKSEGRENDHETTEYPEYDEKGCGVDPQHLLLVKGEPAETVDHCQDEIRQDCHLQQPLIPIFTTIKTPVLVRVSLSSEEPWRAVL